MNDEIMFILRHTQGMSAEYIERKPVPFRKKLVKDLLNELNKNDDGAAGIKKRESPESPKR